MSYLAFPSIKFIKIEGFFIIHTDNYSHFVSNMGLILSKKVTYFHFITVETNVSTTYTAYDNLEQASSARYILAYVVKTAS